MSIAKNLLKVKIIEKSLGIQIKNENIWLEAITHKSWLFFHPKIKIPNNERLEFLGDALLQTITSLFLYNNFTDLDEGDLTLIRSKLVNRQRLGEIAEKLGIDKFMLVSNNLDKKGKKTILGNTLEAIIGALFLDQGWEATKKFVEEKILNKAQEIVDKHSYKDPKSFLQEITQAKFGKLPIYRLKDISGPAHKRKFKTEVYLDDQLIGEGEGDSKQASEFKAALNSIKKIKL
ncbi:MAG: ribonuclease 3 [Candidatus Parcubacteria bacterium]|nr:MAG: ribonuclease 3 [Candidatus Parcubacteria bacterium]